MQLTKNFNLSEFTYSITADVNKINNTPDEDVINNLRELCINVLQPLRDYFNCPIKITSGYRCPALNRKVGGNVGSQHIKGYACDIIVPNHDMEEVFDYMAIHLPYDQLLFEYDRKKKSTWIHVSYVKGKNRKYCRDNYVV